MVYENHNFNRLYTNYKFFLNYFLNNWHKFLLKDKKSLNNILKFKLKLLTKHITYRNYNMLKYIKII